MYCTVVNDGLNGYTKRVAVFYGKALKKMPYASAGVWVEDDGTVRLYSYSTLVANIDNNGWLEVFGLYSATTRHHISAFMDEYGNGAGYNIARQCYEDKAKYNIYTGKVEDI